jgi:Spermine/spermidine synthase domain
MESGTIRFPLDNFILEIPTTLIFQNRLVIPLKLSQVVEIPCYTSTSTYPKFKFRILDSASTEGLKLKTISVFVIPQGQESSWAFSTTEGLMDLLDQIRTSRVVYVILNRGFVFKDFISIKNELKNLVLAFMPPVCKTNEITFMTNGDIGERALIYDSNGIIVEDLVEDDYYLRQLIFLSNVNQVQSEIRLENSGNESLYSNFILESPLLPSPARANYETLTFEYQKAMLLSFAFYPDVSLNKPIRVLILGAGACGFPTFILKHFLNADITAVDINPQVIDIGQRFFGVPSDPRLSIIIEDGLKFVEEYKGPEFDYIFIDICLGDPRIPTPPPEFTSAEFISKLNKIITSLGVLSINIMGNDQEIKGIQNQFYACFSNGYKSKCKKDTNHIMFCVNAPDKNFEWKIIVEGLRLLEVGTKWDVTMALIEYAGSLKSVEVSRSMQDSILPKKKKKKRKKK